jgi:hypothetical protein
MITYTLIITITFTAVHHDYSAIMHISTPSIICKENKCLRKYICG